MLKVIVDTSILISNFQERKIAYKTFVRAIEADKIKFILLKIVREEYISHKEAEYMEDFQKIIRATSSLQRKDLSSSVLDELEALNTFTSDHKDQIKKDIRTHFENKFEKLNVDILENEAGDIDKVFNNYFINGPAFSGVKNRDDIPDAFIYQSIVNYSAETEEEINMIVNDGNLSKALNKTDNIKTWKNLKSFITTKFDQLFTDITNEHKVKEIIKNLDDTEYKRYLTNIINSQIIDILAGKEVKLDYFAGQYTNGNISTVEEIAKTNFFFEDIEYMGDYSAYIPCEIEIGTYNNYYFYKDQFYMLSEDKRSQFSVNDHDWNDYMMEVQKYDKLKIESVVAFYLKDIISSLKTNIEELEVAEILNLLDDESVIFELSDYEIMD